MIVGPETADTGRGELEPVVLAIGFDRAYVPWAATLIESVLEHHTPGQVRFEVLHDGSVTEPQVKALHDMVGKRAGISFHAVERSRYDHLPITRDFGSIVWLRFLLPEILPDRSRVVYLDADTHVRGSLAELWQTPLGGMPIGAVANVVEPAARPHVHALGVTYPGGFFNSGVLVLDLDALRKEDAVGLMFRFAADHAALLQWPDQDVLNAVFKSRWKQLHPRWNAQNSLWTWTEWAEEVFGRERLDEARADPRVRHFEGPSLSKPWHYLCRNPGRDEYLRSLARTPWAGTQLEDRTMATRLIALLPAERRLVAYRRLLRRRPK